VTDNGAVCITPLACPLIVRLYEPAAKFETAFKVRVLDPEPGAKIVEGAKLAVKPVGSPLTDSATCELNPPLKLTFT
jgi:hypothetical protein